MVDIRSGFTSYLLKKEKNPVSFLPRALFTSALTSALQFRHLTLVFFNHQGQNRKKTYNLTGSFFIIFRQ